MKKYLLSFLLFSITVCSAQQDRGKWLRSFPLTNYMLPLNDSIRMVQVQLPDGLSFADKQLGLLRGVYHTSNADTVQKGYGRCYLIKGDYYYFAIGHNVSRKEIAEGDLIYTFMDTTAVYYGQLAKLASHFIELQDVYENKFFDRYGIFNQWAKEDENAAVDSIIKDIKFTGNYFLQNDPSMDKQISSGKFKSRKVLSVMTECEPGDMKDFLDYIIARPRLYAGRQWKAAEIFATWLSEGAPTVIKN